MTKTARSELMRKHLSHRSLMVVWALCIGLTACGGGGGSGSGDPGPTPGPTAKSWQTPIELSTDGFGNAVLAIDGNGGVLALWPGSPLVQGTGAGIKARRYAAASGWSPTVTVGSPATAGPVAAAIDASGNALVAWSKPTPPDLFTIDANRYVPAAGWGNTVSVSKNAAGAALDAQLATDAQGNALLVWVQRIGDFRTRADLWASRFTPAGGWSAPQLLETDDTGTVTEPDIAMNAAGNAVVAWVQSDGQGATLRSARFAPSSGWSTPVAVENAAGDAAYPQVAIDRNGNALVVWGQFRGPRVPGEFNEVWSNRMTADGAWSTAAAIGLGSLADTHPQLGFDGAGNALAVWDRAEGTSAARYTVAGGWTREERIVQDTVGSLTSQVSLAVNDRGDAIATWRGADALGKTGSAYAVYSAAGGPWSTATLIENDESANVQRPVVGFLPDGSAMAVWWESFSTGGGRIVANAFR
jgi:hypothetical protein